MSQRQGEELQLTTADGARKERAGHSQADARGILIVLIATALLSVVFRRMSFALVPALMAGFVGAGSVLNFLSAMMLFDLYVIEGSPIFLGAGSAYLVDALLIIPYGLMFPGVLATSHAFSTEQSSVWLWLIWHAYFPLAIFWGATRRFMMRRRPQRALRALGGGVTSLIFAGGLMALVTIFRNSLPYAIHHGAYTGLYAAIAALVCGLNFCAFAYLILRDREVSEIRLWFGTALIASMLDVGLNAVSGHRFTVPWYVGKVETLVTASVVLVALMRNWANLYAAAIELTENLRLTLSDRSHLQERFDREHLIAAELQQASLPRDLPYYENAQLHAVYRPAVHDLEIGGDWYDAFVLPDERLVLTVGDVAGKGLSASLVMGKVRQMLRIAALVDADPASMLNMADRALHVEHGDTMVTAFVAILDRADGRLAWASAGHPPSLIRTPGGEIRELSSISLPLGLRENDPPTQIVVLEEGTTLVAYTDGLVEFDQDLGAGIERVKRALDEAQIYSAADPAIALFERVVGERARDDVAVVTLNFAPMAVVHARKQWTVHTGDANAVLRTRAEICAELRTFELSDELCFSVELTFGELASNVARYAPGEFVTVLEITQKGVNLTLIDSGAGFVYEQPEIVESFAEHGRGLFLVAAVSAKLEVESVQPHGSRVKVGFLEPVAAGVPRLALAV